MRNSIIILLTIIFISSCSESASKIDNSKIEVTNKDSNKVIEISPHLDINIINAPCIEFQKLVVNLEKTKWISDVERINKTKIYKDLSRDRVSYFNDIPFYQIEFDDSRLKKAYNSKFFREKFDSLDFTVFKGVNNIWGYFYREKEVSDLITDGVMSNGSLKMKAKL